MGTKHMNLFFPQWQGAGRSKELLKGALELQEKYINIYEFLVVDVSAEENSKVENNILGYEEITRQFEIAKLLIDKEKPSTIFTVGGGCDVEILPVSYLNYQLEGDLTLIWIDAHGDLNTPESSPSKNFHGMPLRTILGEGDKHIVDLMFSKLFASQLVMIGQRDLDEPEKEYIDEQQINVVMIDQNNLDIGKTLDVIRSKGSNNIYVHIDLDVLNMEEFPFVMVPAPNGLKIEVLLELLKTLNSDFKIMGLSLLEYTSSDVKEIKVLSDIIKMGITL